ncbi:MAG: hypothetical protein KGZ56_06980 [Dethiobacter sp.]|nr:hypothetical protein [Dethiobacter sp.]MBS3948473.1 hypothetical protein [Dethiobacter sp.]
MKKKGIFRLCLVLMLSLALTTKAGFAARDVPTTLTLKASVVQLDLINSLREKDITVGELMELVFPEAAEHRKKYLTAEQLQKLNSMPMPWSQTVDASENLNNEVSPEFF